MLSVNPHLTNSQSINVFSLNSMQGIEFKFLTLLNLDKNPKRAINHLHDIYIHFYKHIGCILRSNYGSEKFSERFYRSNETPILKLFLSPLIIFEINNQNWVNTPELLYSIYMLCTLIYIREKLNSVGDKASPDIPMWNIKASHWPCGIH